MKKWLFLASAAAISFIGCKKGEENGTVINPQDKGFIYLASLGNSAEIVLGQLAADSSETPAIKEYGQRMVSDHSASQGELRTIASGLGINAPDSLDAAHRQLLQLLLTKKGREFDSLYIHNQVADHRNAVVLYGNAHDLGNNLQVIKHAREGVPRLLTHLQEAESIAGGY